MGFDTRRFDKIYYKNLIKSWHIMKSSPAGIGGRSCYKIKGPDLNPYKIKPITKSKGVFGTKFIDFDMILFFFALN